MQTKTSFHRIAFHPSDTRQAKLAAQSLRKLYGLVDPSDADVIVSLGGDGHMLQSLHMFMSQGTPIYGMNRGTIGFLMNDYKAKGLRERLEMAESSNIHPLRMKAWPRSGKPVTALAFNEVSLLRQRHQAAKISIKVDDKVQLAELICDGILVASPVGSTAYNLSAHGPILPIGSSLLALTPISAFRPRRWRGAILPDRARISLSILDSDKRPVAAVADHVEVRDVETVEIAVDRKKSVKVLFDSGHSLGERVLREQFKY